MKSKIKRIRPPCLKVKCSDIWTIFLLLKILYKNISSHTNRKQNQLSKLGSAQTVALKIRKSDGFRELYENEPAMAAPRLETNIRYLWRHVWWACFHDQKRFWGFREIEFVSRIFWSVLTSWCLKEIKTSICGRDMSKHSHESSNHGNQAKIRSK